MNVSRKAVVIVVGVVVLLIAGIVARSSMFVNG